MKFTSTASLDQVAWFFQRPIPNEEGYWHSPDPDERPRKTNWFNDFVWWYQDPYSHKLIQEKHDD